MIIFLIDFKIDAPQAILHCSVPFCQVLQNLQIDYSRTANPVALLDFGDIPVVRWQLRIIYFLITSKRFFSSLGCTGIQEHVRRLLGMTFLGIASSFAFDRFGEEIHCTLINTNDEFNMPLMPATYLVDWYRT